MPSRPSRLFTGLAIALCLSLPIWAQHAQAAPSTTKSSSSKTASSSKSSSSSKTASSSKSSSSSKTASSSKSSSSSKTASSSKSSSSSKTTSSSKSSSSSKTASSSKSSSSSKTASSSKSSSSSKTASNSKSSSSSKTASNSKSSSSSKTASNSKSSSSSKTASSSKSSSSSKTASSSKNSRSNSNQLTVEQGRLRSAQVKLSLLGQRPGKADGELGDDTRQALRAFQKKHGLKSTGTLTAETASKLDQESLRYAQTRLDRLGYKVGKADGQMGLGTKVALQSFQKRQGLPGNGQLSDSVLIKLASVGNGPRRREEAPEPLRETLTPALAEEVAPSNKRSLAPLIHEAEEAQEPTAAPVSTAASNSRMALLERPAPTSPLMRRALDGDNDVNATPDSGTVPVNGGRDDIVRGQLSMQSGASWCSIGTIKLGSDWCDTFQNGRGRDCSVTLRSGRVVAVKCG